MPPDVAQDIANCATGARFSCRDIASAYRQVLVHPADWPLLLLALEDDLYLNNRLPMGLVSACGIFDRVSRLTCWIILHECPSLSTVRSILDDFLLQHGTGGLDLLSPSDASLIDVHVFNELQQVDFLLQDLGWPINPAKSVNNVTDITWLGIGWNSVQHACYLPPDKALRYGSLIDSVISLDKHSIPLSLARSVIGKLVWTTHIVPQARCRLFYIYQCIFAAESRFRTRLATHPSSSISSFHVHFGPQALHDLRWWATIFRDPPFRTCHILELATPFYTVTTDAAPSCGVGGYFRDFCFSFQFREEARDCHSTFAELLALVIAVFLWGDMFSGTTLFWRTDCSAHVRGLFKLRTRAPDLLPLHDYLDSAAIQHNFCYSASHLPGEQNGFADWLSRDAFDEASLPTRFQLCRCTTGLPQWISDHLLLVD